MATDPEARARVYERAQRCCEYCHLPERHSPIARLQIEHIIPKKHGGSDAEDNLAAACIDWIQHSFCLLFELVRIARSVILSIKHGR